MYQSQGIASLSDLEFLTYHDITRPISSLIKDKKIFSFETEWNLLDFLFFEKKKLDKEPKILLCFLKMCHYFSGQSQGHMAYIRPKSQINTSLGITSNMVL